MSERTKIEHRPLTHAEVKLIKSLQLAKHRKQLNLFIAEGEKLIGEMYRGAGRATARAMLS